MNALLGWLVTYLIHSTVLLGLACVLDRALRGRPHWQEPLWKVALVGGLLTATVQVTSALRPWGGTWSIGAEPAAAVEVDAAEAAAPAAAAEVGEEVAAALAEAAPGAVIVVEVAPAAAAATNAGWGWREAALAGWALGAAVLLGALGRSYLALRRRLEGRRPVVVGPARGLLSGLAARAPRVEEPRLSATSRVAVPIALGIVRPEICLPERAALELPLEAQEGLLAHELGHLVRRDPLWLLVASVIGRALFFQPLNWVAARRLSACAELLADDWAARRTASPLALAECLTAVARWRTGRAQPLPVPAMAAHASELRQRVERLVSGKGLATGGPRPLWTGTAASVVLCALALLAPSACGVAEAKPPATPGRGTAEEREAAEEQREAAEEAREAAREAAEEAREEAQEAAQEARKEAREAAREARREARRARDEARRTRDEARRATHRGPGADHDHDDDDDDDDDHGRGRDDDEDEEDEDEDDLGAMHLDVNVPPLDLNVDLDVRVGPTEEELKRIEKSLPSPEQIDAMMQQAWARQGKNRGRAGDAEMRRAQAEARAQLAEARERVRASMREAQEHMREAQQQMREAQRVHEELRARMPEIQRQAQEAARDAAREAEKAKKQAEKEVEKARKEKDKARKEKDKARRGRDRGDGDDVYADDDGDE